MMGKARGKDEQDKYYVYYSYYDLHSSCASPQSLPPVSLVPPCWPRVIPGQPRQGSLTPPVLLDASINNNATIRDATSLTVVTYGILVIQY